MNETPNTTPAIARQLAAPFAANEVHLKPGAVSGNRALAMQYIDARAVMDRLDAVLGIDGWRDAYEVLDDGAVLCRLSCRIGETWIEKADVGGASDQKDAGDRRKAAFSDALKRAAVKFGIGRYLYSLAPTWRDYDPRTKQFAKAPAAPPAAAPKQTTLAPAPPAANGRSVDRSGYPVRR